MGGYENVFYEALGATAAFAGGLALWFLAGKKWLGIAVMAAAFAFAYFKLIQPMIA